MTHPIVRIQVVVHIAHLTALGRFCEEWIRFKIADVVADATGENLGRARIQSPGFDRLALVVLYVITHERISLKADSSIILCFLAAHLIICNANVVIAR